MFSRQARLILYGNSYIVYVYFENDSIRDLLMRGDEITERTDKTKTAL